MVFAFCGAFSDCRREEWGWGRGSCGHYRGPPGHPYNPVFA
jgi:hypothetical protein